MTSDFVWLGRARGCGCAISASERREDLVGLVVERVPSHVAAQAIRICPHAEQEDLFGAAAGDSAAEPRPP